MEQMPLDGREYGALRALFGLVGGIDALESRIWTIPNGWRDYRLAMSKLEKLMLELLKTIPKRKLRQIRLELDNMRVEVKVDRDVCGRCPEEFVYVSRKALDGIVNELAGNTCLFCQGCTRGCQTRKNIEALYPFEFQDKSKTCPFMGLSEVRDED